MTAQNIQFQIIPTQGNTVGAVNLLVVPHGLSVPSILYTDATLTTTLANPLPIDATGNVDFWLADDSIIYDGFVSGGYVKNQTQIVNIANATNPYLIDCYVPTYFTLDLVPQLGGQLGSISVEVVHHGTTSAVSLYSDNALSNPLTNPFVINSNNISFWVADGSVEYDLILTGGNLRAGVTIENIWSLPGPIWADISTFWADVTSEWAWISPYNVFVKTIQNVGQLYTGNDLIRAAMRLIQVAAVDTDLTASELRDGLESLNRMIDAWALEELMLYQVTRETFPLAASQLSYSVGLGGDFDTVRPTKLVGAYLTISTGSIPVDYPMQVIGYDDYNDIRLKTLQTNFPSYCYYEPAFPLANLYVYPVCAVNNESITLTSWKPLSMIADPTATVSLPPGYWEAIVFNLAVRIAEEYQFDMRPTTIALAESSLKKIKRMNQRTLTLQTDVALMNTAQMRYNVYSDGYGR